MNRRSFFGSLLALPAVVKATVSPSKIARNRIDITTLGTGHQSLWDVAQQSDCPVERDFQNVVTTHWTRTWI